jgi:uncharacterized protein (TIGR03066 family)
MIRSLFTVVFVLAAGLAVADDKKDEKKTDEYPKLIVGKWEITKAGGDVGPGSTLEFGKGGKFQMDVKAGDKKQAVDGKYKVEKDKVTITLMAGDQTFDQTLMIRKLTAEALELVDKDGGVDVLKKVKKVD